MNINLRIYRAIQKGLNEALSSLSIDNFDDVETPYGEVEDQHEDIVKQTPFHDFVKNRIIGFDDSPLATWEQQLIKIINSNTEYMKASISPLGGNELKNLIKRAINFLGNNANLNWINTSNITNMDYMFFESMFNGDISKWDVSNVTKMNSMFLNSPFNGDISKWDVSNVTNMDSMFKSSKFNGDISNWDVSNVTNMDGMFYRSRFDKDISKWNVSNVEYEHVYDPFGGCNIIEEYKPKFNR